MLKNCYTISGQYKIDVFFNILFLTLLETQLSQDDLTFIMTFPFYWNLNIWWSVIDQQDGEKKAFTAHLILSSC